MARPVKYKTEEEKREAKRLNEKRRRDKDPEKFKNYRAEYYKNNRETLLIKKKDYHIKNREKRIKYNTEYHKKRIKSDPIYKFSCRTIGLIHNSFKRDKCLNLKKNTKTVEILGCSIEEFRNYILSKCPKDTKMEDFNMYGYHIDHIIPISLAKSEEEVIKLCHYTNLQPMWCTDNIRKSNKIVI
jgi:hypothetical protein